METSALSLVTFREPLDLPLPDGTGVTIKFLSCHQHGLPFMGAVYLTAHPKERTIEIHMDAGPQQHRVWVPFEAVGAWVRKL